MIYPENGFRGSVEFMTLLPRMVGKWPKSKLIGFELFEFELIDSKVHECLLEFST